MWLYIHHKHTQIDLSEHYLKQSYRNRTQILTANGLLSLSIPVKKVNIKPTTSQMLIENDFQWQKQHWEAIVSAYNSSPYFYHYRDYFEPLYAHRFLHLHEWNHAILQTILKAIKHTGPIIYTQQYQQTSPDWRTIIHPKRTSIIEQKSYIQVFSYKFGYVHDLSFLDVIFNLGPRSADYLQDLKPIMELTK
jgi:hypothetical protein